MSGNHAPNWPVYSSQAPAVEIVPVVDDAKHLLQMQVEINGNPDMGIVFKQGYVGYWVDYDYPLGKASSINRVEVLGTKRINNEECYEVKYVNAEPDGEIHPPSYWYYVKRMDKIYWVRFTYERDGQIITEEVDDSCPTPTKIRLGMYWHGHDIQRDTTTGEVYVSRHRSTKAEAVVELRIGSCVYHCLQLVMFSADANGTSAHTLVEKYIDRKGLTILRRKYMGEDNVGDREQLRQSPQIKRDGREYYLWYDSVFL